MIDELYKIFLANGRKVTTDSRKIERGALFFALKGDNFDGNRYAAKALESGAAVAVVDDKKVADGSSKYIVVADVLSALQELALYHRKQLNIEIVALTGSNGKTTTKEFLKLALATKYRIQATVGNFNNHIGVPLTLLSLQNNTQIGIVEMGASHCDEIASLCAIALPKIGLITNIGKAHLEGFGGVDGVRKGKGELFDFLQTTSGVAIYNADDPTLTDMVSQRANLKSVAYKIDEKDIKLNIFGKYNIQNAASAMAIANYFGVENQTAIDAIASYNANNNRSQIVQTKRGNTLIVDCYNANPSSMRAAIEEFISSPYINKVAIIGDMKELGSYAADEHKKIEKLSAVIEKRYFVGDIFCSIGATNAYLDTASLAQELNVKNSTILLKGSHSIGLENLIDIL